MSPSRIKVRFTPVVGGLLLALGLLNLVLGVWLLGLGEFTMGLLIGVAVTVAGAVQLTRTYFWFDPEIGAGWSSVSGPGRFGPLARGVTAERGERFAAEGAGLVHVAADGTRTPVPVRRWMANRADWRALEAALLETARLREPRTPDGGAS
ncbi:hypothetical protein [Nocardiopsis alborubida]|uniref:Uncharacterized protein n=1 Tax=Nocardiopsis alborubida TaxID=146802 RepID=A0A7X6M9Y1_9ACTN|nr:hypothetical protein [Nocardiopsis alborubida]NKY96887.1 hypothetical protein [Nocardiopsis alborubida]